MKRSTVLYAATVLTALSFASQAFAKGGSMAGGQSHGNTGGTHQLATSKLPASGNGIHQHTMGSASLHGPTAGVGAGTQQMNQEKLGNSGGHQYGQMNGTVTGSTAMHPLATASTD
ncbi:MAG: hypothetical protein PHH28_12635 [Desulfuromonadaceae bacterium]|nr:hypothetical protein [Desulfuromonadaceae bacterium]